MKLPTLLVVFLVSIAFLWSMGTMICSLGAAETFPWPFQLQLDQQAPVLVHGSVADQDGQPLANAKVAVIATHPDFNVPVLSPTVIGETVTNGDGQFSMSFAAPTPYQCRRLWAIAGRAGQGFSVERIDLAVRKQEIAFRLKKERSVKGRVLGPNGEGAAGVRVQLRSFSDGESYASLWPSDATSVAWPKSATTNKKGSFHLRGIPDSGRPARFTFEIDDQRFAPQKKSVTTRGDEEVTLRLSRPGIVEGFVVRKDSATPLSGCWMLVVPNDHEQTADIQALGLPTSTDTEGHFRIRCHPNRYLTIYVYPPEGEPYPAWVTPCRRWPEGELRQNVRIEVPRGMLIRGKVIEAESGIPVAGSGVEYWLATGKNSHVSRSFAQRVYWAAEYRRILTRQDGTFEVAVIPGPGYLLAKAPNANYVSQQITHGEVMWKKPGGYYMNFEAVKKINPTPDDKEIDVTLKMQQGVTLRGRVEGPEGQNVGRAVLLSKSFTRVESFCFSSNRSLPIVDGRFELPGCDPEQHRTVYILDADHQWGATVTLDPREATQKPPVIRLQHCGSATVRLLKEQGKPLVSQSITGGGTNLRLDLIGAEGLINPSYGIQARRHIQWGMTILDRSRHRSLHTDESGLVTFPTLIPNAPYKLIMFSPRNKELLDFDVEAGSVRQLGEIILK